jgi:hypothetical protein
VAAIVADAIQRKISRDAEHPRATARGVGVGHRTAGHAKKHFLRQLLGLPIPDEAAEIAEYAVAVRAEQNVCVAH